MASPLFSAEMFHPHGLCYLWHTPLIWLHVVSDALIFLAYIAIPVVLVYFVWKRRSLPFPGTFLMFGAFIVACGTTHLMEIWMLWTPDYWLSRYVKGFTAVISVATAIRLVPLVPQGLALRTPAELEAVNTKLATEVMERKQAEEALQQAHAELERRVQERTAELQHANDTLRREIIEREQAQAERDKLTQQLMETSRRVGMADVATSVLHNVGNVLNSVNVSAGLILSTLRQSPVSDVGRICALLHEHAHHLGDYLTHDTKGQQIPGYLTTLAVHLDKEHETVLKEVDTLNGQIDHIKQIISTQQAVTRSSGLHEPVLLQELMEQALAINTAALDRHRIEVIREYADLPQMVVDKHQVLQILVNLISNAKYAMMPLDGPRQLTLQIALAEDRQDFVRLQVRDTGVGIKAAHLTRIFSQGFTTKQDGHGFGLHSGALAAKVMGGSLSVASSGEGQGATFTLDLPAVLVEAHV